MYKQLVIKDIVWVSLVEPKKEDLHKLSREFPQIDPFILEELLEPTIRPRVEDYGKYLFMVLHFPRFSGHDVSRTRSHEIDFILTEQALITVQYSHDEIYGLETLWEECEKNSKFAGLHGKTPADLLSVLLQRLFASVLRRMDQIQKKTLSLEEEVFAGEGENILKDISLLKKTIMDFRRAIKPQHLTLETLAAEGVKFYGERTKPVFAEIIGEYLKVGDALESNKEALDTLYEMNTSLLSVKINKSISTLTFLALMTFIPMTIASLYGLHWIVFFIIAFVTYFVYCWLKKKNLV